MQKWPFLHTWPGIKPQAPGQRLPVPAGWRCLHCGADIDANKY